ILSLTLSYTPSFSSAALPYLPARHRIDVAHGKPGALEQGREVETRLDIRADARVLRRDQHQSVAEEIETAVRLDQILLLSVIHPIEISRDEDVRRRALFDLLDERVARRVGNDRFLSSLALPLSCDVVERVLQACGREYNDILALGRGGLNACSPCQSCGDKQGEPTPSCCHSGLRLHYIYQKISLATTMAATDS